MNFGGFFVFNAVCDVFNKLATSELQSPNIPIPAKIKIAGIVSAICLIATVFVIALCF